MNLSMLSTRSWNQMILIKEAKEQEKLSIIYNHPAKTVAYSSSGAGGGYCLARRQEGTSCDDGNVLCLHPGGNYNRYKHGKNS